MSALISEVIHSQSKLIVAVTVLSADKRHKLAANVYTNVITHSNAMSALTIHADRWRFQLLSTMPPKMKEQLDYLNQNNITFLQGYCFYKPVSFQELLKILLSKPRVKVVVDGSPRPKDDADNVVG
ncbi:hypothetical protein SAMN05192562_10782 [Kosakonia arachidis]|uniref:EAL domain-containing protein n=1 Tax=Kosakonia arachidis TaxID=551989 RepID=A0A1I7DW67_9ENTR|nr:hypothetical protein SAMN05192562_10782 [Kosakonia arachidis]